MISPSRKTIARHTTTFAIILIAKLAAAAASNAGMTHRARGIGDRCIVRSRRTVMVWVMVMMVMRVQRVVVIGGRQVEVVEFRICVPGFELKSGERVRAGKLLVGKQQQSGGLWLVVETDAHISWGIMWYIEDEVAIKILIDLLRLHFEKML